MEEAFSRDVRQCGGLEATRRRRGWLVRRYLLAADTLGLTFAFVIAGLVFPEAVGRRAIGVETAMFCASLPAWIVAAKVYGLYDRDEERAAHSTIDELAGVFHLVTVGVWTFLRLVVADRAASSASAEAGRILG